ncbi:Acetyl-CoA acetyltransferase [Actinokineospora alba]|uniref:propanoyl-CoA C-acyltransferase n=1 Tax=Actinokineospora alba TaxID=504798 RepID=A0A1H0EQN3_9PSEU|nr:lipid-transfer protein [Actinokineospora alba]TDP69184.1 acetyl-CoA acetyltransferase [Actinokineospora alba]SDI22416.1 Acetyl-CoA acetyltransferase [Actinokineospora alba]SDN84655.1 Acetyl-CoA acetyltransferase [Actinokineospora alba]
MGGKAYVIGVGMTKFEKPGSRDWDYPDMAREAGTNALADAGIDYSQVQQAYVGYVYGESTSGQRAVYELGMTGIPVVNVNNNCSTGSTALFLATQAVKSGQADVTLALGFEKMQPGSLGATFEDREQPMMRHLLALAELQEFAMPPAPYMFGAAGREHMQRYGTTAEQFAKIGVKNHKHSVNNPYAQFQVEYSLEDVLAAKTVYDPLTKLQCSPTSDGSGAVIVASEAFVEKHGLAAQAVEIVGQAMVTDLRSTFEDKSAITLVGADMTRTAVRQVYEQAGIGPSDVDVIELHDCFSTNELLTYEALGLCPEGEGGKLIDAGETTYGGKWVVNPSGGLISKGHPLGATGLAQCSELTWQLRGTADKRQVDGAKVALQHNIGLGGAVVITAYRPADR